MSVRSKCPGCGASLKISLAHAGKKGKCPGCGKSLKMPSEEQLRQMMARQASKSSAAAASGVASTAAPPKPSPPPQMPTPPPTDDLFDDLGPGGFDDDDFDVADPPASQDAVNPYASPLAEEAAPGAGPASGAEAKRKRLLSHESNIKSMGSLFVLGSVIMCLLGALNLVLGGLALVAGGDALAVGLQSFLVGAFATGLGVFQGWTGLQLRKCSPAARIPAIFLSAIGLLGIPIGTLMNAFFLYLIVGKKGKEVLTTEYQQVIASTPHIKQKTSIIVWIFVGLLVVVVGLALVAILASPRI